MITRGPKLNIRKDYKKLMKQYYIKAKYARWLGKKVAWLTSGAPVELVYAMGAIPVYPENHGAICGATKMATDLCRTAESAGYSQDLCSYMRNDIGSSLSGKSPIGGLPRPDFLVCCNNICGTVVKWFQIQSRYYNVPLFIIDTPYIHQSTAPHAVEYVKSQLEEFISFLEKQIRKKFRLPTFIRVMQHAHEGMSLWRDILYLNRHRPAPMTCFDAFVNLAPIVTMRGTKKMNSFYRKLKAELEQRIEQGFGAISEERFRLLWDNIPIWYEMRGLAEQFTSHGANLVADTYTTAWALGELDNDRPLESLAETYTNVYLNQGVGLMTENFIRLMDEFSVDGFVMHSNRSCKPYSLGQYDMKRMVSKKTGKPGLIIEADMTDSRMYFDAQTRTKIAAFIEML
ncbi:2-hydroxyglutaryl-CoA dehydratase [candidate division KSB1 bacterium]|nr:2-hydroxyglutaryl-CoA dehydratase [candidate division KSB1 bacterium]